MPTETALEYRSYFHEILIDEYQDSNLVQEYILSCISGEEEGRYNRFMVGDVKQSIYKFRLARPELFLEKYEAYAGQEETETGNNRQPGGAGIKAGRIDLHQNFRSRREVLDSTNMVFEQIMGKDVGGLVYDDLRHCIRARCIRRILRITRISRNFCSSGRESSRRTSRRKNRRLTALRSRSKN